MIQTTRMSGLFAFNDLPVIEIALGSIARKPTADKCRAISSGRWVAQVGGPPT